MEDEDPHGPEPGDFTICSHCVTPLRVNPDGNAVRLDQLELMTISASLRSAIMHMLFVRWQKRQYDASPLGWSIEPLRGMVDWLPAKED